MERIYKQTSVRRYDTITLGMLKNEEEEEEEEEARRKKQKKNSKSRFTSRGAYVKLHYIVMLYTHWIGNQTQNTMVVFNMCDSVPSSRYSIICNVLRQWKNLVHPYL